MINLLANYGLFLAKAITVLIVIILLLRAVSLMREEKEYRDEIKLKIKSLNDYYAELKDRIFAHIADRKTWKNYLKEQKKTEKAKEKEKDERAKLFVMNFEGDLDASEVENLREQISAILQIAEEKDQVLLKLESAGGFVHSYGLAASQLKRIRDKNLFLTISVDKVAASGGYMMAAVANEIIAAPFAVIGSIGVVGGMPNFYELIEKYGIHYEQHTAGKHKRTLTMFGENSEEAREQFIKELKETHELFKNHIKELRPQIDIEAVATGETWYGSRAVEKGLIDKILSADDFLLSNLDNFQILELSQKEEEPPILEKLKSKFLGSKVQKINQPFKAQIR